MYQLEVKRWLVHHRYAPRNGWRVLVHVDPMERGKGRHQKAAKRRRARVAEWELQALGATIGRHPDFGPADVVAEHKKYGVVIIEVEGESRVQKQQALYSALGQLLIQMHGDEPHKFVLAFPDQQKWVSQAQKITPHTRAKLDLSCLLVSPNGVREA